MLEIRCDSIISDIQHKFYRWHNYKIMETLCTLHSPIRQRNQFIIASCCNQTARNGDSLIFINLCVHLNSWWFFTWQQWTCNFSLRIWLHPISLLKAIQWMAATVIAVSWRPSVTLPAMLVIPIRRYLLDCFLLFDWRPIFCHSPTTVPT